MSYVAFLPHPNYPETARTTAFFWDPLLLRSFGMALQTSAVPAVFRASSIFSSLRSLCNAVLFSPWPRIFFQWHLKQFSVLFANRFTLGIAQNARVETNEKFPPDFLNATWRHRSCVPVGCFSATSEEPQAAVQEWWRQLASRATMCLLFLKPMALEKIATFVRISHSKLLASNVTIAYSVDWAHLWVTVN